MPEMPGDDAQLQEIQDYIKIVLAKRGFSDEGLEQKFLLFVEEVGEFAKAIRQNSTEIKNAKHSKSRNIEEEAGDVLILFLDLLNKLDIKASEAFKSKETINRQRTWT